MSAFRIFSRFAELLDINVTRAAAAWLRLNADGTVSERTAAQTLSDLGGISGIDNTALNAAISTNTSATRAAMGLGSTDNVAFAEVATGTTNGWPILWSGGLLFRGRERLVPHGAGVLSLTDNTGANFNRLAFGGVTSAYPSLKRNGPAINIRLADDSADAPLTASNLTASGDIEASTIAKGLILKSPDGTRYRVTVANGGTLSVAAV
jgi:hypothetical protein